MQVSAQSSSVIYAEAVLANQDLLPGEQTSLEVQISGIRPDSRPIMPDIPGVAINFVGTSTHIDSQRQLGYAFSYRVTPVQSGDFTLPSIEISTPKGKLTTAPVNFTVHSKDKLTSFPTGVNEQNIKAAWFTPKDSLYQNEQAQVFLKLYIPRDVRITSWGFPEATKTNCLAWRFSPPSDHSQSVVQLDNVTHNVVTYSTTLSGINPGKATLGPAELNLYQRVRVLDSRRGYRSQDVPISLSLPAIDFNIKPLPAGAPADFNGAVGSFDIDAFCRKSTFSHAEPTEVILRVAGTGNLPTIKAPSFNNKAWKVIDTSKITRGEERRELSGLVTFRQLLRVENSNELPQEIPPYSFSYFNPESGRYRTKTTQAIPVTITAPPASAQITNPVEELGTLPEEMRSIIGFIDKPDTQLTAINPVFFRLWHVIPAAICLLVFYPVIRRKIIASKTQSPNEIQQNKALSKLTEKSDTRTFYRRAGRFIEQWLPINPDLAKILEERDNICFTGENQEYSELSSERKSEIIALLKRSSKLTLLLFLCFMLTPDLMGQEDPARAAWKSANYQEAIDQYREAYPDPESAPSDVLFNIGNSHHRLDQLGLAAHAWRQALAVQPSHQKARQNLRYVEIQTNANVPEYKDNQYLLLHAPRAAYDILFYAALWTICITVLIITVRRPNGAKLTTCIVLLVIAPLLAAIGKFGSFYYPDDHRFASIDTSAVILTDTKVREEAHRSAKGLGLPAASLVKVNATRGPWTHVTTATDTNGWVENQYLKNVR